MSIDLFFQDAKIYSFALNFKSLIVNEKIKKYIYAAISLKENEAPKFFLLFFHSFFLGIFVSVYYTLANSVFIQHFESKYLSVGYLVSGVAGYLTTIAYSYIQRKYSINKLFLAALLFVFGLSIVLWLNVMFFGAKAASFMLFVFSMPFQSLIALEMGGLALQLLDIKQIKRLFGLINTGTIMASILGYMSIPLILKLPFFSNSFNLLFIGIAGVSVSTVLLLRINKKFSDRLGRKRKTSEKNFQSFGYYLKDKFFVYISISVILSAIALYFADFGFLAGLRSQETLVSTPEGRANFLAIAYGLMKTGELTIAALASRFFSKYGMNLAISTISFIETALVMIATMTGFIAGEESVLLFIFILLNKSFDSMLRRTINDPSFKILYQTLPEEQRLDVQTKVGMVSQLAIILSGGLLMLVNQVFIVDGKVMFKLFLLTFVPILLAWLYTSRKMYQEYKKRLRIILTDKSFRKKRYIVVEDYSIEYLITMLNNPQQGKMPATILAMNEFNSVLLTPYLPVLLKLENQLSRKFALDAITPYVENELAQQIKEVLKENLPKETGKLKIATQQAINCLSQDTDVDEIDYITLLKSKNPVDVCRLISHFNLQNKKINETVILELLDHTDKHIKQTAIRIAVRNSTPMLLRSLYNMVTDTHVSRTVLTELQYLGDEVLDDMDKFFKEATDNSVLLRIIEMFAHVGTDKAKKLLVQHLQFPDKTIMLAIIKALKFCKYQADAKGKILIRRRIESSVQHILWTYSAIIDLSGKRNTLKILQSIDMERETEFDILFDLLSLIYEWAVIDLIKKNFIGEENIFALELIDNFIEQEIKDLIIPLFEGISISQQLRKLENQFPQPQLDMSDRLKDIINRDYNKVDLWTKTKAIELLAKNSEQIPQEIYACLHHKNELIWSTAAQIVYSKSGDNGLRRLKRSTSINPRFLRSLERNDQELQNIITEKVKLIKRVPQFFGIPENELVKLAEVFRTRLLGSNAKIQLVDDYSEELIVVLIKGRLQIEQEDDKPIVFSRKGIIIKGFNIPDNAYEMLVVKGSLVLVATRADFFNMVIDELVLTRSLIQES